MRKAKAILYDLGDVFFEAHYWRLWMYNYFKDAGVIDYSFYEFYIKYESFISEVYKGKKDYNTMYLDFLTDIGIIQKHEFMEKSFKVKEAFEKERVLFDGVFATLKNLKEKGILNIIITDNESGEDWIRKNILNKFGINNFIFKVYTSLEIGFTKPSKEFFDIVLEKLSLQKENVIFVAHDQDEIDGAIDYGLKVIEFNNYLDIKTKATLQIKKFKEINNYI